MSLCIFTASRKYHAIIRSLSLPTPKSVSFPTMTIPEGITYLCLCFGFLLQMMYTYLPPFLRTLLHPSHSFLTELRTFIPRTCCLVRTLVMGADWIWSLWKADVSEGRFDEHWELHCLREVRMEICGRMRRARWAIRRDASISAVLSDVCGRLRLECLLINIVRSARTPSVEA